MYLSAEYLWEATQPSTTIDPTNRLFTYFAFNSNYKHLPILLKIKGIIEIIYFLNWVLGWRNHGRSGKVAIEINKKTPFVRTRKLMKCKLLVDFNMAVYFTFPFIYRFCLSCIKDSLLVLFTWLAMSSYAFPTFIRYTFKQAFVYLKALEIFGNRCLNFEVLLWSTNFWTK